MAAKQALNKLLMKLDHRINLSVGLGGVPDGSSCKWYHRDYRLNLYAEYAGFKAILRRSPRLRTWWPSGNFGSSDQKTHGDYNRNFEELVQTRELLLQGYGSGRLQDALDGKIVKRPPAGWVRLPPRIRPGKSIKVLTVPLQGRYIGQDDVERLSLRQQAAFVDGILAA